MLDSFNARVSKSIQGAPKGPEDTLLMVQTERYLLTGCCNIAEDRLAQSPFRYGHALIHKIPDPEKYAARPQLYINARTKLLKHC